MRALQCGQRVLMDHYRPWGDQFPPLQPVFRQFMTHPRFLGLVVHSAFSYESYRRLGVPEAKLRVVHNGFDPHRMEPVLSKQEARALLELPQQQRIVTYAGRINDKKGLDVILELAGRMPEVLFVLVGSTGRGPIETEAEAKDNVRVIPWQESASISPYLYASDVLTIPPSTIPLEQVGNTVLPLKLFLYLAAGRAIFAGANPDTAEILEHDRNAWLVSAGDPAEAEQQLRVLLGDTRRLERLGRACREQAAGLTWDSRAAKIDAFIDECLARDPAAVEKGPWSASTCARDSIKWLATGISTGKWIYR
jgi:glycosyltransferase involved in cell wall biosynthesis